MKSLKESTSKISLQSNNCVHVRRNSGVVSHFFSFSWITADENKPQTENVTDNLLKYHLASSRYNWFTLGSVASIYNAVVV